MERIEEAGQNIVEQPPSHGTAGVQAVTDCPREEASLLWTFLTHAANCLDVLGGAHLLLVEGNKQKTTPAEKASKYC